MLEIDGLLDRRVTDLSGGERQRVALGARADVGPVAAPARRAARGRGRPLRRRILPYLQRVRDELTVPIIYVSHDREEVDELADVVVNVDAGRVVSVDQVRGR